MIVPNVEQGFAYHIKKGNAEVNMLNAKKKKRDLADKRFWRCDACLNYVGVHPGGNVPLGCISNAAIRNARNRIHEILDPIWKQKRLERRHLYARLTKVLGRQYHTGELRTLEEARMIYKAVRDIERELAA